jgi:sulfite reductase (NADPH) flavoprotein alpha-component
MQRPVPSPPRHDRQHPYLAQLIEHRRITTDDAVSGVYHLVLGADSGGLSYRPGDALGVVHRNDPALVEQILRLTGLSGDAPVTVRDQPVSLFDALTRRLEVTQLHPAVVAGWADIASNPRLQGLAEEAGGLRGFVRGRQLIDLLQEFPAKVDAARLATLLRPLQPRLYSIASSQSAYADEVHLTVSTLAYQAHGRDHLGAASGWLTRRLDEGADAEVYVAENPGFRLPEDGDTPIIMVGVGTGIAPYRGFLQERELLGHGGRNWLVFGNRHFHRDFLYQKEWIDFRKAGLLTRASLAFSRDSAQRPYVQDRLVEEGSEIYRWLNDGARLYVCGGLAMEKGVLRSLQTVVQTHGGLDADAAARWVEELRAQGRYLKDVY